MSTGDLTKIVLYAGAPFFCYPYKPILNQVSGSSFHVAYKHFRRDHATSQNLGFHFLCLIFQLTYNFSLLGELDDLLRNVIKIKHSVSFCTASMWIATLLTHTDSPIVVKVGSSIAIWLAFHLKDKFRKNWIQIMYLQSIIETLAIPVFLINKQAPKPFDPAQFLFFLTLRLGFQRLLLNNFVGVLLKQRAFVNSLLFAGIVKTSQDPFGKLPVFFVGFIGWILSILTNQRWLLFYSGGYLASIGQGVAHYYSQEQATLPTLSKIGDELAHTTYFPNLLLQSIYQSFRVGM